MKRMQSAWRTVAGASLIATLGACAQYGQQITGTTEQFRTGAVDAAIATHEKPYEGTLAKQRDLLYYFETGELQRARPGSLDASTQAWLEADSKIRGWEDEARGKLQKSAGALGAWLLDDSLARYDGQDYEKVMLSTRLAENQLAAGKWDDARVEIRKMYERESLIASLREKQVDAIKAEEEKNGIKDKAPQIEEIKGYPVEIFNDPQVTNLRNSYQSAASHYLAGFVFQALHEPSLAAAGYRKAIELRPDVPALKLALERLDKGSTPAGKTDVLFLIETGWVPARDSLKTTLPVPVGSGLKLLTMAYPVIRPTPDNYAPVNIQVGDTSVPAAVVTNLDAMARRSLKDDMPTMIARSLVRMAISGAAQELLQHNDKSGFGSLMSLAVGVTSAATASTDTREWRTLPAYISLARTTIASGAHTVSLDTPQGRLQADVQFDGPYAVVVVRPLGNRLELIASQPADRALAASPAKATATPAATKTNTKTAPVRSTQQTASN